MALYYRVRAYACSPRLYSSYVNSSTYPIYTACDEPATPTVNTPTTTTLNVTLNAETPAANPAITTYSIYCVTTGTYVKAPGALGAEVYQPKAAWGTNTVTGLACNTSYTFYAKAKNYQEDVRYNSSNTGSNTTTACRIICQTCPSYDYSITPSTSWQFHSSSIVAGGCKKYYVYMNAGTQYIFSLCSADGGSASYDSYLRLYDGSCTNISNNDDYCGLGSYLSYTAATSGVYYLEVNSCCIGGSGGDYTLAYQNIIPCTAPAAPATCSSSIGFTCLMGLNTILVYHVPQFQGQMVMILTGHLIIQTGTILLNHLLQAMMITEAITQILLIITGQGLINVHQNNTVVGFYSSTSPIYTACDEPASPTVGSATSSTLNVSLNTESQVANPAITTYSIYCVTTANYVTATGASGTRCIKQKLPGVPLL